MNVILDDVIAMDFWVAPDLDFPIADLVDENCEASVKEFYPSLLSFIGGQIVAVGIADENVGLRTTHWFYPMRET